MSGDLYQPPTTLEVASWVLAADDPFEAAERARAWCYVSRDVVKGQRGPLMAADLWLWRAYALHGMALALAGSATCGRSGAGVVRCGVRSCQVCRGT